MFMSSRGLNYYMRALHRDVGFFVIGVTIVLSFSGILLLYRTTDLLKFDTYHEKFIDKGLDASEIGGFIRQRELSVVRESNDTVYFTSGLYVKSSGFVSYTKKELPAWISKMNDFHTCSARDTAHWFMLFYAIALLFLAISSFWMFKASSRLFIRGIVFTVVGVLVVVLVLILMV